MNVCVLQLLLMRVNMTQTSHFITCFKLSSIQCCGAQNHSMNSYQCSKQYTGKSTRQYNSVLIECSSCRIPTLSDEKLVKCERHKVSIAVNKPFETTLVTLCQDLIFQFKDTSRIIGRKKLQQKKVFKNLSLWKIHNFNAFLKNN